MRIIFYLIISIIAYAITNLISSKIKLKKRKVLNIIINLVMFILSVRKRIYSPSEGTELSLTYLPVFMNTAPTIISLGLAEEGISPSSVYATSAPESCFAVLLSCTQYFYYMEKGV